MDTNTKSPKDAKRPRYRRHPISFKRKIVIESLKPGASVSRIARQHDINANQIFAWRKAYHEGVYGKPERVTLLPVTISEPAQGAPVNTGNQSRSAPNGCIELMRDGTALRINGHPDPNTLRLVLAHWFR
ncbi:IS66-like element accessory protein TnpA [Chitinimonas sp. PSY-7]|uniref:IS66-like element accessory protein TnpA n=1 Tax=Chitinimonas sp. PSY-7 TaxID=3459088 RepID=UPI00403FF450